MRVALHVAGSILPGERQPDMPFAPADPTAEDVSAIDRFAASLGRVPYGNEAMRRCRRPVMTRAVVDGYHTRARGYPWGPWATDILSGSCVMGPRHVRVYAGSAGMSSSGLAAWSVWSCVRPAGCPVDRLAR